MLLLWLHYFAIFVDECVCEREFSVLGDFVARVVLAAVWLLLWDGLGHEHGCDFWDCWC